ncbi:DUF2642 domain-containing protein [Cytobacillus horneckiae]|uniref:DUF2642 domain-containing protein n=1 Tax=Cytobacillus horneckiae TaxID=549687 RepID=UPI003D1ECFF4
MRIDLSRLISVPAVVDLSFIDDLVSNLKGITCPIPPTPPTPPTPPASGIGEELLEFLGSRVIISTPAGPVIGILSVVNTDYAVVTSETSIFLVPFNNMLGLSSQD